MGPRIAAQVTSLHRITTTHLGDAIAQVGLARQHDGLDRLGAALRKHAQRLTIGIPHVESLRTLNPIDDTQIAALHQATGIARIAEEATSLPSESIKHLLQSRTACTRGHGQRRSPRAERDRRRTMATASRVWRVTSRWAWERAGG